MGKQILFSLICILLIACSFQNKQSVESYVKENKTDSTYVVHYAKGFEVKVYDDCKQVIVKDPWDSTKILHKYVLVDKKRNLPQSLPEGILIRTPLSNVLAYSTIHCSLINELKMAESIKGVCEPQYISVESVLKGVADGRIKNLGQSINPNKELMIELDPEAVFIEPIQGRTNAMIQNLGIPVIETPDYMESTPLGRAEWIRFYGLFYNRESLADSLFTVTEKKYNAIKEKIADVSHRPTVFLDLMYRGVWYMPTGNSFMAKMMSDAGAKYVWYDDKSIATKQLSFEQVLDKASDADFWLIKYNAPKDLTYKGLESEYLGYSSFDAFNNRRIYASNTAYSKYYQDLPIHPDYILQDLAYIFHPDLFPSYRPKYYFAMQ